MNFILGYPKHIFLVSSIFIISCNPSVDTDHPTAAVFSHADSDQHESLYFGEGYSVLSQKGNKVFIDSAGNSPSELSGDRIRENVGSEISSMNHFHHGLAEVMVKNERGGLEWAYINKKGENPFGKSFSYAGEFKGGHAIVKENDYWGIIDEQGKYLIEPRYDGVSHIIDNNVWIKQNDGWEYVSYPGMARVLDGSYQIYGENYEGTFWVDKSNGQGDAILRAYANKDGKIISSWFSNASNFSEGLAAFEQDGKWGFIDKRGNIVIEPQFGYASGFSEDLSAFTTITDEGFGDWGYIDKKGRIVIPMTFKFASDFKSGFAEVRDNYGARGFIDKEGRMVVDYLYDLSYNFHEGLAAVKKDNKWGFIDTEGDILIPMEFDNILTFLDNPFDGGFSKGIAKVEVDGYDFFIDKTGSCVIGCLE